MAEPQMPEQLAEAPFPLRGIDVSVGFASQPGQTTPVGKNVRGFEPLTMRGRGGARPGLSQYIPQQLPSGKHLVQHLNYVVDPTEAALLDEFDSTDTNAVNDPSTNSSVPGVPARNPGRKIRYGGSGRQPNRNKKSKNKPAITSVLGSGGIFGGLNFGPCCGGLAQGFPGDVTITGTNLGDLTAVVKFGTLTAAVVSNDGSTCVVTSPASPVALVDVTVTTPQGTSPIVAGDKYTFVYFEPQNSVISSGGSATYGSNVKKNNLLVALVWAGATPTVQPAAPPSAPTITSFGDTQGNSWNQLGTYAVGAASQGTPGSKTQYASSMSLWYAVVNATGANTVSGTGSGGSTPSFIIFEVQGAAASSPADGSTNNTGATPGAFTTNSISASTTLDFFICGVAQTISGDFSQGSFTGASITGSPFGVNNTGEGLGAGLPPPWAAQTFTGNFTSGAFDGSYVAIGGSFRPGP